VKIALTQAEAVALRGRYYATDRELTWADRMLPYRRTWGDLCRWIKGER
jgi:hypothetical protein